MLHNIARFSSKHAMFPLSSSNLLRPTDSTNIQFLYETSSLPKISTHRLTHAVLFDVSLRDGIQNADPANWSTHQKKIMLHHIFDTERPTRMEVGSLVSQKVLPIMADSLELYNHGIETLPGKEVDLYMLVPTLNRLYLALNHDIAGISLMTSVSNAFQQKNVNRTLEETKKELMKIDMILKDIPMVRKKLYISCITECPIDGKQDIDYVLREILLYHTEYTFEELCLSDTCGTMSVDEYVYLLDSLIHFGVPASKISLHLHVNHDNLDHIRRILWRSFDCGVNHFDVSMLATGGCSVTMDKSKLLPNLSYDLFYRFHNQYYSLNR